LLKKQEENSRSKKVQKASARGICPLQDHYSTTTVFVLLKQEAARSANSTTGTEVQYATDKASDLNMLVASSTPANEELTECNCKMYKVVYH
jgi:hypothetical protein